MNFGIKNWQTSPLPWLLGWFLLNLLQAAASELARDEAYYWAYAQYLDWGYYDHPPAIAFLIKIGSSIISGELGVRILIVFLTTLTQYIGYQIIKPKNLPLYFTITFSPLVLHMAGFIATPDALILFSSTIFFFLYQKYCEKDNLLLAFLLGITVAVMGYSKYDGVLVLIFALIAYPKIAKRWTFWMILAVGTLLYFPHLYWQHLHEWQTIRFHLTERMPEPYNWLFPLAFPAGQLLVFGGLVSPIIFWAVYRFQAKNQFERVLRTAFFGVFGFFWLMTLKGRVEANWTISMFLPIAYMSYHFLEDKADLHKWVYRLALGSVVLIMAFRFYLLFEYVPRSWTERDEFHGWPQWSEQLAEVAGERPVVFYSTYAYSSQYWFYSKKPAYAFSTLNYNGNQYDLWNDLQESLQGKEVFILSNYYTPDYDTIILDGRDFPFQIVKKYYSYNRLKIGYELDKNNFQPKEKIKLLLTISNPTTKAVDFSENKDGVQIRYDFFEYNKFISGKNVGIPSLSQLKLNAGEQKSFEIEVKLPEKTGDFRFRIGLKSSWQPPGQNGAFRKINIK